jgi:hypothetical protein
MELFMIKTGFYGVVKDNEAGRWLERADERRERADALRAALLEQHRRGEGRLPPSLLRELERAEAESEGGQAKRTEAR